MKRVEDITITVNRDDLFDVSFDKYVYHPIARPVRLGKKATALANELIKVGFTDNLTLGVAPALELMHRLVDICNGFEPIREEPTEAKMADGEYAGAGKVSFKPLAENPKLEALLELIEEIGNEQLIIWCARRNAIESIEEALRKAEISFVTYTGSQTAADKSEAEKKISAGDAQVFLANPASAGFGLNCLAQVNYAVWYCVDASVERYQQALHRILRGQSKVPKYAYKIFVKGSIEERNYTCLEAGKELLTAANRKGTFLFTGN